VTGEVVHKTGLDVKVCARTAYTMLPNVKASFPPVNQSSEVILNEEMQNLKNNFDMFFLLINGLFVFCKFTVFIFEFLV
jgi:hypothetical protein